MNPERIPPPTPLGQTRVLGTGTVHVHVRRSENPGTYLWKKIRYTTVQKTTVQLFATSMCSVYAMMCVRVGRHTAQLNAQLGVIVIAFMWWL